jgi:hypothetical protein
MLWYLIVSILFVMYSVLRGSLGGGVFVGLMLFTFVAKKSLIYAFPRRRRLR